MTLTLTEVSKTVEGSQTGMAAIKFSGEDVLTGKTISLENCRGKYVFIDFWGTWCSPCLGQLPELTKLYASVDTAKIIFIGIAGRDKPETVLKLVKDRNIPWHNIVSNDTNSIIERYNIVAFPTGILISPEGKIVETDVKSLRETLTRYRLVP